MDSNIVHFDLEAVDFESAVDEVDILIPKYLESLTGLEVVEQFEDLPRRLQNVSVYWERLSLLFEQLEPLEEKVPFKDIMFNALQSELSTLEKVYLKINLQIEFNESEWTRAMWKAADEVLDRMDTVLESLGFDEFDDDRILIADLSAKNRAKYQKWLLSSKVLRR